MGGWNVCNFRVAGNGHIMNFLWCTIHLWKCMMTPGAPQVFVVAQCDLYCWRVVGRSDCSRLIKSKLVNLCISVYTMGDFVCYLCTISRLPLDGNAQLPETFKGSKSALEIE
jgi:hypothetical protein